ncbi:MAG: hypothetical protein K2Z81_24500, partial [Cyanobacteria bacterium]|nr:hypothetical protein [Cyanobacteriota bacterium]
YLRVSLIKKDDKKWLITSLEEISPNIWRDDGVKQEELDAGGVEGEGEGKDAGDGEDIPAADDVGSDE